MTARHECGTTYFCCISADLLRHEKTIIGEEDDKLVSMTAHCEFHLSSKPLFTMSHTWLNLHRGMKSRLTVGSDPHIAIYMCMHLEYKACGVFDLNVCTWINMYMSSKTNWSNWNANTITGEKKKTMEREQSPFWKKRKEKQQKTLEGSLQWVDMIDKDCGAICYWWLTDGESEWDVVFWGELVRRNRRLGKNRASATLTAITQEIIFWPECRNP